MWSSVGVVFVVAAAFGSFAPVGVEALLLLMVMLVEVLVVVVVGGCTVSHTHTHNAHTLRAGVLIGKAALRGNACAARRPAWIRQRAGRWELHLEAANRRRGVGACLL